MPLNPSRLARLGLLVAAVVAIVAVGAGTALAVSSSSPAPSRVVGARLARRAHRPAAGRPTT